MPAFRLFFLDYPAIERILKYVFELLVSLGEPLGAKEKEKGMREKSHLKSIVITAFLVAMILSVVTTNQALGVNYKAIDLTPSGFDYSYAYGTNGTQQVGYGSGPATGGNAHALLWSGSAASCVDLNPIGFTGSIADGISGTQQVGYGSGPATGGNDHALLWNGSANSYVDLHPVGFDYSIAYGTNGTQQVGYGCFSGLSPPHALLWSCSAASCVDLNPIGFTDGSIAAGISGTQQVGWGDGSATGNKPHALLWNGSATSYVDLNPNGFWSYGLGISGTQQVGEGVGPATGDNYHALLWNGSADSYIDLNPSGFKISEAYATNGTQQVGVGDRHALLWNGSATNYIDLHQFLPEGFIISFAFGIDSYGNIVGEASGGSFPHAFLWQPIPEPATLLLLGLGAVILRKRRK